MGAEAVPFLLHFLRSRCRLTARNSPIRTILLVGHRTDSRLPHQRFIHRGCQQQHAAQPMDHRRRFRRHLCHPPCFRHDIPRTAHLHLPHPLPHQRQMVCGVMRRYRAVHGHGHKRQCGTHGTLGRHALRLFPDTLLAKASLHVLRWHGRRPTFL